MTTQITGGSYSESTSNEGNAEIYGGVLFAGTTYWLSLHTASPGITGAHELTASTYSRQPITFGAYSPTTSSQSNTSLVSFSQLAAATGGYWIGLWESQSGPDYLVGDSTAVCGAVSLNQAVQFPLGTVVLTSGALSGTANVVTPTGGTVYGTVRYGTSYYGNPNQNADGGNGVLPSFSALPLGQSTLYYLQVNLSWSVPNSGYNLQLVRNSTGVPFDHNDGLVLLNQNKLNPSNFVDLTLTPNSQGQFLYYRPRRPTPVGIGRLIGRSCCHFSTTMGSGCSASFRSSIKTKT
jgi:hypothetical protein